MASTLSGFVQLIVVAAILSFPGLNSAPARSPQILDAGCVIPLYTSVIGDVIISTNHLLSEEKDILEKTSPSKSIGALLGAVHGANRVSEYIKMDHESTVNNEYPNSGRHIAEDVARRVVRNGAHVLGVLGADTEEFGHMLNACRVGDSSTSINSINGNDFKDGAQFDIVCNKDLTSSLASLDSVLEHRYGIDVKADVSSLLHSDVDHTVKNRYLQAADNFNFDELEFDNMSYEDLSSALDALLEGEEMGDLDELFMDVPIEASGPDHSDYLYGAEEAYAEDHAAEFPDDIDGFALENGTESFAGSGSEYESAIVNEVAAGADPNYNGYDIFSMNNDVAASNEAQQDAIKAAVDSAMLSAANTNNNNIVTPYTSLFHNQPSLLQQPVRMPAALSRLTSLSAPASAPASVATPLQGLLAGARIPNPAGLVNNVRASAGVLGQLVGAPVAAPSTNAIAGMGFPVYPPTLKGGGLRGAWYR